MNGQLQQHIPVLTGLSWFRSDVYISAVRRNYGGASYYIYPSQELLNLLNQQRTSNSDQFDLLYIQSMEVRQFPAYYIHMLQLIL